MTKKLARKYKQTNSQSVNWWTDQLAAWKVICGNV